MTARRPFVEIPGTPPKFKELVDTDDLIVPRVASTTGLITLDQDLVPWHTRQRALKQWVPTPGGTTWTPIGFTAAPTTSGTLSNVDKDTGVFIRLTTAGSGTAHAEVRGAYTETRSPRVPILSTLVRTPASLTNLQIWCGLTAASLFNDPNNAGVEHVAFRFDSALDTNWRAHTSNGTASIATDTGIVASGNTEYLLEVAIVAGVARFLINGVDVLATSTNLPAVSTPLGPYACITEKTASAKTFDVGLVTLWTR